MVGRLARSICTACFAARWAAQAIPCAFARRSGTARAASVPGHGDDDVADLLPGLGVPVGLGDLIQWVVAVDDRRELAGFHQVGEMPDRRLVYPGIGEQDLLAAQQRVGQRQDQVLIPGPGPVDM